MIGIIDYGSGNISAIAHIYKRQNIPFYVVSKPDELVNADRLILPGVGAFDETITLLESSGFRSVLDHAVLVEKKPILGVCVGMQVMGTSSEEGELKGLNWIPGHVKKFHKEHINFDAKLPHMGWNSVSFEQNDLIFKNVDRKLGFYFLHSYHFVCDKEAHVIASAEYGKHFTCAIQSQNVYGFQFHPEKSHENGIHLFTNFANL